MVYQKSCRISTRVFLCCAWMASLSQVAAVYAADRERSLSGQDVQQEGTAHADAEGTVSDIGGSGGTVTFDFDAGVLDALGIRLLAHGQRDEALQGHRMAFGITTAPTLDVNAQDGVLSVVAGSSVQTRGAILLDRPSGRVVIGNLRVEADPDGALSVKSTLEPGGSVRTLFELESVMLDSNRATQGLRLIGELALSSSWAAALGLEESAAGTVVGTVVIEARVESLDDTDMSLTPPLDQAVSGGDAHGRALAVGDVIVASLPSVLHYGSVGDIHAFAVGTTSCNIGDARVSWVSYTNQHPVIAQEAFRLKDDRFEEIGLSWVKHGFYAVSGGYCGPCLDPTNGTELGVGCSDPYSASLNGIQSNMSPRSIVDANTGYFPYPAPVGGGSLINARLQIHAADIDTVLNDGARYFVQGHYVSPDDAAAGTDNNDASYREVLLTTPAGGVLIISPGLTTQQQQPAVRAWQDVDEDVDEVDIQLENEGLFILAAKAIYLGFVGDDDLWRYSYALQNLNSDRCARSFTVLLPADAQVSNIDFHDVDYHSGETYDLTDWTHSVVPGSITWSTSTFAQNPNANALRWGTLYNFYLDVNAEPADTMITMGLFKPGTPDQVQAEITGPALEIDCNNDGIHDPCNIDCGPAGGECDVPGCGGHPDCNGNGIPDMCDIGPGGDSQDCQPNGIPDECDIDPGDSEDCQPNGVPDECDIAGSTSQDCNTNGVPDECAGISWPCEDDCECDNGVYCDGAELCALWDCMPAIAVDCDDGVDCTDDFCNEDTDACDNTANDANCDNGLYCDGYETCHPVDDCQPGEEPCPGQFCDDETFICLSPPELPSNPVHHAKKHRYLSINPSTNAPNSVSIKVEVAEMRRCTGDLRRSCLQASDCRNVCDDDPNLLCLTSEECGGTCIETGPCIDVAPTDPPLSWIVQGPLRNSNCPTPGGPPCEDDDYYARLDGAVYAQVWTLDTLHIGDCQIIPGTTYNVYACDPTSALLCGEPLVVGTQVKPDTAHYGDTAGEVTPELVFEPPDGFVNVRDISAWQLTNQNWGTPNLPQAHLTWIDLHGNGAGLPPNYILNITDLTAVTLSWVNSWPWEGAPYGGLSPGDCP